MNISTLARTHTHAGALFFTFIVTPPRATTSSLHICMHSKHTNKHKHKHRKDFHICTDTHTQHVHAPMHIHRTYFRAHTHTHTHTHTHKSQEDDDEEEGSSAVGGVGGGGKVTGPDIPATEKFVKMEKKQKSRKVGSNLERFIAQAVHTLPLPGLVICLVCT